MTAPSERPEQVDVLIVGAGISGIGAAWHLSTRCPDRSFLVLDALESFGGTWLTHRYPGARSDTDLYTYGYGFKPWMGPPIATAGEILAYMGEVIADTGLADQIRYRHRITAAGWSSETQRWTIDGVRLDTDQPFRIEARFLWMCQGYYRHDEGFTPRWPGMDRFDGPIVHPQTWPEELPLAGQRIVVIGSGATAATLAPALAEAGSQVTMLQRSPTYFRTGRNALPFVDELRELGIDPAWIHEIIRRKTLRDTATFNRRTFTEPEIVRRELLDNIRTLLGPDYDVDTHFTPSYRPWQQRLAFVPDADLFQEIRAGRVTVVTDEIEAFEPNGLRLRSGRLLDADIVVTATGLNLLADGGIAFEVDGEPIRLADRLAYRGMMFEGVPNLAWVFGYFRASWTLRADMVAGFVCRLLDHLKERAAGQVTASLRPEDRDMPVLPWIDEDNFNPGYLKRGMHMLPKRGDKPEWQHLHDYWAEKDILPTIDLDDPIFVYR